MRRNCKEVLTVFIALVLTGMAVRTLSHDCSRMEIPEQAARGGLSGITFLKAGTQDHDDLMELTSSAMSAVWGMQYHKTSGLGRSACCSVLQFPVSSPLPFVSISQARRHHPDNCIYMLEKIVI